MTAATSPPTKTRVLLCLFWTSFLFFALDLPWKTKVLDLIGASLNRLVADNITLIAPAAEILSVILVLSAVYILCVNRKVFGEWRKYPDPIRKQRAERFAKNGARTVIFVFIPHALLVTLFCLWQQNVVAAGLRNSLISVLVLFATSLLLTVWISDDVERIRQAMKNETDNPGDAA